MLAKFIICTFIICIFEIITTCKGNNYDDVRCICICPFPSVVNGTNRSNGQQYIGNVPPNKCDCDGVVLPKLGDDLKGKEQLFCPRCDCHYENRNTTIIRIVVIFVIWIISLLCIYMLFLMCLDPFLNRRAAKGNYQEHTNEDDDTVSGIPSVAPPDGSGMGSNVLHRVGHPQDKWKKHLRQVEEQRKHIYDQHTMLN